MGIFTSFRNWFRWGSALDQRRGDQRSPPTSNLVDGAEAIGPDSALQISTVWSCVDRRAKAVASLPFFAYETRNGEKQLARLSRLYGVLHDSPNPRMTPFEFWSAMMLFHDLRNVAYARIDRADNGEAIALWPMPSDQVTQFVLDDGSIVFEYRIGSDVAVLAESNVLVLRGLGNGTAPLEKLDFMRASLTEAKRAQTNATQMFGSSGKPTGVLMFDNELSPDQRAKARKKYGDLVEGATSRLIVLEANMKYQTVSLSPEDQQLLETRRFSVEELCRWFDVPPVLVHHANVTAWGSGIEQIFDGWYKLAIRPMLVSIEQAVRKRVMTPQQRATMSAEIEFDALLRANAKDRAEHYAKLVQNGIMSRSEVRQLENLSPRPEADALTAQSNLVPLELLGKVPVAATPAPGDGNADSQKPTAQ